MRKVILCAPFAVAFLLAPAAQAQSAGTVTIKEFSGPLSTQTVRPNADFQREYQSQVLLNPVAAAARYKSALQTGSCLKARNPQAGQLVGGAMSKDPRFTQLAKALGRKFESCVQKDAIGTPMTIVNGALAEALIEAEAPKLEDRAMPRDIAAAQAFYMTKKPTIDSVTRCVAVFAPGLVAKALEAAPGSAQEKSAVESAYVATPQCGLRKIPTDVPLVEQRAALATGLYHWTHAG